MAWLNYIVAVVGLTMAAYLIWRLLSFHYRLKRASEQSKAEWAEIQKLIEDPATREQAAERYLAKLQQGPPRTD